MISFNSDHFCFYTPDINNYKDIMAIDSLSEDPLIREYLGTSFDEFLTFNGNALTDSAYLVGYQDTIIGYMALFDYYKYLEMQYAVLDNARGRKLSLNETTGSMILKESSKVLFRKVPSLEYIRLCIDKNNIRSIKTAQSAGFVLTDKSYYSLNEYRKVR